MSIQKLGSGDKIKRRSNKDGFESCSQRKRQKWGGNNWSANALKIGDTTRIVAGMSSEGQELGLHGVTWPFATTNGWNRRWHTIRRVFSHNILESRIYSFGTNISGGSAIAGAALSMGIFASTYGAISSGVAAVGQVAGAQLWFYPVELWVRFSVIWDFIGSEFLWICYGYGCCGRTAARKGDFFLRQVL